MSHVIVGPVLPRIANIPITVISEGMGHSSIQTTQIYLASLNDSIIDGANKRIINKIKSIH